MRAVVWQGKHNVQVQEVPDPKILNPRDAIVRVTLTAICGSDLHLYNGDIPTMQPGDVVGHEFMGEVVDVGREVKNLSKGDWVVVPFAIACGGCFFCQHDLWSLCDNTNPNASIADAAYGYSSAGLFGYSHMYGGYPGGQAEYVRVPFADVGPVKIYEPLNDEQVFSILQDTYIPGVRMSNPDLRRWFGEADAWWLDNLRRKALEDPAIQDQALVLGMRAGDYAQSFGELTCELKRPLTTIFRELAGNSRTRLAIHPHNRAYNLPVQEFLRAARADLMYLNLPAGQADFGGPAGPPAWQDTWVLGRIPDVIDDFSRLATLPQSKKAYLEMVDRILLSASRIRKWAVECRDIGLASARDISDLIKTHRNIQATYSKDLTEISGGLRNYVMVSELA